MTAAADKRDLGAVHHVEVFREDATGEWGWQCFTCGAAAHGFSSASSALAASDEHEGACRCESH